MIFSVVIDELVEFEKGSVEGQEFRKVIDHFRRICRMHVARTDIEKPKDHNM
jgi:hypothetical protein